MWCPARVNCRELLIWYFYVILCTGQLSRILNSIFYVILCTGQLSLILNSIFLCDALHGSIICFMRKRFYTQTGVFKLLMWYSARANYQIGTLNRISPNQNLNTSVFGKLTTTLRRSKTRRRIKKLAIGKKTPTILRNARPWGPGPIAEL